MADVGTARAPSLAEDYLLKGKDVTPENSIKPVEEAPVSAAAEEVVPEETPAVVENNEIPAGTVEASSETSDAAGKENTENSPAAEPTDEEGGGSAENETLGDQHTTGSTENETLGDQHATGSTENETLNDQHASEEAPEIKLETAPADFRFPTTNQTRHCFTRYIEYHRCVAAKGDDAPECQKFAKYYRSLCPGDWIDKWNEERENGTFPGPL